jgi:hypothetical protein
MENFPNRFKSVPMPIPGPARVSSDGTPAAISEPPFSLSGQSSQILSPVPQFTRPLHLVKLRRRVLFRAHHLLDAISILDHSTNQILPRLDNQILTKLALLCQDHTTWAIVLHRMPRYARHPAKQIRSKRWSKTGIGAFLSNF